MKRQHAANGWWTWFLTVIITAPIIEAIGVAMTYALNGKERIFGLMVIALGIVVASYAAVAHQSWTRKQQHAERVRPSQACELEPVVYDGWHGTMHTFYFINKRFTSFFRLQNARKIVG